MIVAVANLKGGVGKTTSSVLLAHAVTAATGDRCVVIDADPQGSAALWAKVAAEAGRPLAVPVLAQPTDRLAKMANVAPHLVIDTPPAYSDALEAAISVADFVVVPTSASAMDLSAIRATVAAARRIGRPAAVLLTRTRRVRSVGAAEHQLRAERIDVLGVDIPLREALAMAFGRQVRELFGYDLAEAEIRRRVPARPRAAAAAPRRMASLPATQRRPLPPPMPAATLDEHRAGAADVPDRLADDDLILRIRSSMARLAAQR